MILKVRKHAHGYEEVSLVTKATVLGVISFAVLSSSQENEREWREMRETGMVTREHSPAE